MTGVPGALMSALLGAVLGGCVSLPASKDTGLRVVVALPVPLPAGSAHSIFQQGRVVRAASLFEPFCELEVSTLAPEPSQLPAGRYRVTRVAHRLLQDPITRIPAVPLGLDCTDGVFQESIWRLMPADAGTDPDARQLRCIAPYFDCRFGPPLAASQIQLVVGHHLAIEVTGP